MNCFKGGGRTPFYFPFVSEAWIRAAGAAGGRAAQLVGFVLWQRVKLDFNRRGGDPLEHYATLTRERVCKVSPMADRTFAKALEALAGAGLIEVILEARGQAYKVRLVPLPDEVDTTRRLLLWSNERPRKRKHN